MPMWAQLPGVSMLDLFGLEQSTKRSNNRPEAAALVEVMQALRAHPAVAWCERMNSRAARMGARFVRFGWPGCPDVLGQLNDGRLMGVEGKARAASCDLSKPYSSAACVVLVVWPSWPATAGMCSANLIEQRRCRYDNHKEETARTVETR